MHYHRVLRNFSLKMVIAAIMPGNTTRVEINTVTTTITMQNENVKRKAIPVRRTLGLLIFTNAEVTE